MNESSDMRVLHVIGSLDPKKGGPSVSCPSLACAQIPVCKSVGIFTYNLDASTFFELSLPNQERLVLHTISANRLEKLFGFAAKNELRELVKHYDVVHVHGVWNPLLAEACLAAKRVGIPYVIAPRGMLDPWSLEQKKYKKKISLMLRWNKILTDAHFIHALNQDEADLMSHLGLDVRVRVSPNGIFEVKVLGLEGVDGAEYQSRYGKYILFMSRLHYKKGLDYLIDGYREYLNNGGDARLVIAGPDEGEESIVQAKVAKLGLQDHVDLIGPVYGNAKFSLLKGARVFCLPSRQEGFSMAIIEALAMGVPVVISKGCHFDQVAEAGAGDVVDLDAVQIGRSLYHYADGMTDAGLRGVSLIRSEYVWEAIALKVTSFYR